MWPMGLLCNINVALLCLLMFNSKFSLNFVLDQIIWSRFGFKILFGHGESRNMKLFSILSNLIEIKLFAVYTYAGEKNHCQHEIVFHHVMINHQAMNNTINRCLLPCLLIHWQSLPSKMPALWRRMDCTTTTSLGATPTSRCSCSRFSISRKTNCDW